MTGSPTASRIDGLDLARGIAVLGMVGAHVGNQDDWPWLVVTHGFPSALFAVLAGVSMTLMLTSRGRVAVTEVESRHARRTRIRIAVRGAILVGLGLLLALLGTPVVVILPTLGVMFWLALPLLRAPTPWLLALAAACLGVGGYAAAQLAAAIPADSLWGPAYPGIPVIGTLWGPYYPALAWMGYVLVGLGIGRLRLREDATALLLVGLGACGFAVSRLAVMAAEAAGVSPGSWWLDLEAHSYSPPEMLGDVSVACAAIGASLWLARRARTLLWPVMAVGAMALTAYVGHLIVIAAVGTEIVWQPSNVSLVAMWAGIVLTCSLWRWRLGAGPLERWLTAWSTRAAEAWAPRVAPTPSDHAGGR
ncbi:heparan-alpha-glucosaminide N-acetyltransferase domain-containing protein [Demequina sp. NBRC 110057]|uniref:heparan-alpha-glucosaminide N-acetyltransferase domain-containing protein n=1 Tax=Demequina sp. NBRC 110057 TaxID=1570346 RepID=UPI0009FD05B6|nr:heparan-alpha-glucosaminide N-acetyltransferase domain-containing protein [Demequina sp. NBRC 110057]